MSCFHGKVEEAQVSIDTININFDHNISRIDKINVHDLELVYQARFFFA